MLLRIWKKTREEECLELLVSSTEAGYLLYVNEVFTHFQRKTAYRSPVWK